MKSNVHGEIRKKDLETNLGFSPGYYSRIYHPSDDNRFVEVEVTGEGVILKIMDHNGLSGALISWKKFDQMQIAVRTDLEPE